MTMAGNLMIELGERRATLSPHSLNVFGRMYGSFWPLHDSKVSRLHAAIFLDSDHYRLRDLRSNNGTYLNHRKVTSDTELHEGDRITLGPVEMALLPDDSSSMSETVKLVIRNSQELDDYVKKYLADPLQQIRDENKSAEARPSDLYELVKAHRTAEEAAFPYFAFKDAEHYEEISNIDFLFGVDYLPGKHFRLGDPSSWEREKLRVGGSVDGLFAQAIVESKMISLKHKAQDSAKIIFSLISKIFPHSGHVGNMVGTQQVGAFVEQGGYCRHKAAALQLAFQEAGLISRYVRGCVNGGSHAWVELDLDGNGEYSYVCDPALRTYGKRSAELVEKDNTLYYVKGFEALYCVQPQTFNTVWRPRQLQSE